MGAEEFMEAIVTHQLRIGLQEYSTILTSWTPVVCNSHKKKSYANHCSISVIVLENDDSEKEM